LGEVTGTGVLRVLTLNLWGRQGAWDERRSVLVEGLRELASDLVVFQEAIVGDGYDQVADLLDPSYHVVHQGVGLLGDGNHGASIMSSWPLGEVREVDLHLTERTQDYPCAALAAEVLAPELLGPPLLMSYGPSHQLSVELEREMQAATTARFVEEHVGRRERHVVLAGDFNADPEAASVRFWCGRQSLSGTSVCYRDSWEEAHPAKIRTKRSPPVTRWSTRTSRPLSGAGGWTTSSCAAAMRCTGLRSRSPAARWSSTSPLTGCGRATPSASSRTSPPGRRTGGWSGVGPTPPSALSANLLEAPILGSWAC
jgi:endonuclease/exonuclease/phosphatase family metal-dependent hydrolase